MAIPTVALSEASPAGGDNIALGDNRIREYKTQVREIMEVNHDFPSSGNSATAGQHKKVTLQEQADIGSGSTGVTQLGGQTIDGKPELVYTDEDDNDIQLTKAGVISFASTANKVALMNLVYPVGSVVTLGVSTNPNTLYGVGTWTAIQGRVVVGLNAGDTEFDTLNETGGAKTVTLTGAQSGVPAHTHNIQSSDTGGIGGLSNQNSSRPTGLYWSSEANVAANAAEAHTNLMPYITKYVWERTA
jgi:hypothetical protein